MRVLLTVSQMLVRITGVLLLILGLLIWAEGMRNLVLPHILLGLILVISLWVLAATAARLGAPMGMAVGLFILALIVLVLGVNQQSLFASVPVGLIWVVQVVHLLLGMAAVGMAEALGGRLRRAQGERVTLSSRADV